MNQVPTTNDASENEINPEGMARRALYSLLGLSAIPGTSNDTSTNSTGTNNILHNNMINNEMEIFEYLASLRDSSNNNTAPPINETNRSIQFPFPQSIINPLYSHPTIGSTDTDFINNIDRDFSRFMNSIVTPFGGRRTLSRSNIRNILQNSLMDPSQNMYKTVLAEEGEECIDYRKYLKADYPNNTVCSMTLKEFEDGDEIAKLPCGHIFEKEAILKWLKNENATCPICRKPLPSKEVKKKLAKEQQTPSQNTISVSRSGLIRNFINEQFRREEEDELQAAIMASLMDQEHATNND